MTDIETVSSYVIVGRVLPSYHNIYQNKNVEKWTVEFQTFMEKRATDRMDELLLRGGIREFKLFRVQEPLDDDLPWTGECERKWLQSLM